VDSTRFLPKSYDVRLEEFIFHRVKLKLHRVADPGSLIDSVDASSFGSDERFPYWSEVWPSSLALANHLSRGTSLAGTKAVELGCGMGLAGVLAALKGAHVTFTDFESPALAFARANHALNLRTPGATRLFDWRDPPRGLNAPLVLASDVLYEKRFLDPFIKTIHRILPRGGRAVVAEPGRRIAEGTVEKLESLGFKRSLALEEFQYNQRPCQVWVHTLTKGR
jgi:predicted nicotinamide N-methyase